MQKMDQKLSKESPMKFLGDDDQAHTEPHDTYRIAYMIHFFLGAGNLLPWNAFITAIDYFGYVYPSYHVEKVFAVAYMGSSLLVLASMMFFGGRLSVRWRLNVGFSMFIFSLLVTVTQLMDWTRQNSRWSGSYKMTVAAISVCGLADGLIGGSLLGSAGKLPKQYMQAVFAGTASSGISSGVLFSFCKSESCHDFNTFSLHRIFCLHHEDSNKSFTATDTARSSIQCAIILFRQFYNFAALYSLL
ncbi:hypothetical protein QQ045_005133 [Rhodiola kirilowii]